MTDETTDETTDPARIVASEQAKARRVLDAGIGKVAMMHNPQEDQIARLRRASELDEMDRLAQESARLQRDNAALREIAQAVAGLQKDWGGKDWVWRSYRDEDIQPIQAKARALLAKEVANNE
ncbi:MAG TPA: hypothetical protein VMV29_22355 [Ktedonobacterales bacterium]|nr:hypothetical protein [Ktedonobacterales bacterium]